MIEVSLSAKCTADFGVMLLAKGDLDIKLNHEVNAIGGSYKRYMRSAVTAFLMFSCCGERKHGDGIYS